MAAKTKIVVVPLHHYQKRSISSLIKVCVGIHTHTHIFLVPVLARYEQQQMMAPTNDEGTGTTGSPSPPTFFCSFLLCLCVVAVHNSRESRLGSETIHKAVYDSNSSRKTLQERIKEEEGTRFKFKFTRSVEGKNRWVRCTVQMPEGQATINQQEFQPNKNKGELKRSLQQKEKWFYSEYDLE